MMLPMVDEIIPTRKRMIVNSKISLMEYLNTAINIQFTIKMFRNITAKNSICARLANSFANTSNNVPMTNNGNSIASSSLKKFGF